MPKPISGTSCGLPSALSAMFSCASRRFSADGRNDTVTVQICEVLSEAPRQVVGPSEYSAAFAPEIASDEKVNVPPPALDSVTVLLTDVLIATLPKPIEFITGVFGAACI